MFKLINYSLEEFYMKAHHKNFFYPLILTACIPLLQLTACSRPADYADNAHVESAEPAYSSEASVEAQQDDSHTALQSQITEQEKTSTALIGKQLVISASANFQVENVLSTVQQVEKLTIEQGGYIANSQVNNHDLTRQSYSIGNNQQKTLISYIRQAKMTVRVPKANVSQFLQKLQSHITFLNKSEFSAQDITLDIQKAEIEAKIQSLKSQALQNQTLNNQNENTQSGNVDIINQKTIAQQQQRYAELQKQALLDQMQLSTIHLEFSQPEKLTYEISDDIVAVTNNEQTSNFIPRLLDNLRQGWYYFIEFILWLSQLWAFIIALPIVIWGIKRLIHKWKNYRQKKQ